jgi:hypothetical protein
MQKRLVKALKKIRVIDYLLLLFCIPLIIFAVFYFRREKTFVYVDLTFQRNQWQTVPDPPEFWKVSNIQVGDTVYNSLGSSTASVVDVEKSVWGGGARTNIALQLKVQAIYDTRTKKYVLDGNPLLIGNHLSVDFGNNKFDGVIMNVYRSPEERYSGYQKARAIVKIRYRNIEPWHAESLKNFVQLDSKNRVVIRTLSMDILPAETAGMTDRGEMVKAQHPFKKDVVMTLELPRVLCRDTACYYNMYNTFEVGGGFWADNGKTLINEASVADVQIMNAEW